MISFYNPYGLLNASSLYPQDTNENSSLYIVEFILKAAETNVDTTITRNNLQVYYNLCQVRPTLWNQLPFYASNNDDFMSHDQLTGMLAFSEFTRSDIGERLWKEIKRQGLRYNNITPDSPGLKGLLHPRDIFVFGIINGCWLWWLTYPLLLLIMIESQLGITTSGKCLNWVRCKAFGWNRTLKLLEWFMPYKSWAEVFQVYFPDPQHPINKLFVIPN